MSLFDNIRLERSASSHSNNDFSSNLDEFLEADSSARSSDTVRANCNVLSVILEIKCSIFSVPLNLFSVLTLLSNKVTSERISDGDYYRVDVTKSKLDVRSLILRVLHDVFVIS
jgi:hypothetical protein